MKDFSGAFVFVAVFVALFVGFFGFVSSSSPDLAPVCLSSAPLESVNEIDVFALAPLEGSLDSCLSGTAKKQKTCRRSAQPVDSCDSTSDGTVLCGSNSDQACVYKCVCENGNCKWKHQTYCDSGKCDTTNTTICQAVNKTK